jgi:hypothetical protein
MVSGTGRVPAPRINSAMIGPGPSRPLPAPRTRMPMSRSALIWATLRELEAAARLALAVLLALDHAAVAGQEAGRLQRCAQPRIVKLQRLRDAVLDGTGLARKAAALDGRHHVELAFNARHRERLAQDHLQHRPREIDRDVLAVHGDLAEPGLIQTRATASLRLPVA